MFEPPLFTKVKSGTGFLKYPGCAAAYECYCSADEHCAPEWRCMQSVALPQFKARGLLWGSWAPGGGCQCSPLIAPRAQVDLGAAMPSRVPMAGCGQGATAMHMQLVTPSLHPCVQPQQYSL